MNNYLINLTLTRRLIFTLKPLFFPNSLCRIINARDRNGSLRLKMVSTTCLGFATKEAKTKLSCN